MVAYLRSQPATGGPTPKNQFNILGAIFTNLSDFRTAQQPVAHVTAPQAGTPEYGKYLVDIMGCRDCHGDQLQGRVENGQPGPPRGPNLTLIVPKWTEEEFITFFNTLLRMGGERRLAPEAALHRADVFHGDECFRIGFLRQLLNLVAVPAQHFALQQRHSSIFAARRDLCDGESGFAQALG